MQYNTNYTPLSRYLDRPWTRIDEGVGMAGWGGEVAGCPDLAAFFYLLVAFFYCSWGWMTHRGWRVHAHLSSAWA